MKNVTKCFFAICLAVILAGCTSPPEKQKQQQPVEEVKLGEKQPPAELAVNEQFAKDEGAHFESPMEFWYVCMELDSPDGKIYVTSHFQKTGSVFMHARNAYNSVRMPDGSYDYRSVGQPLVKQLGINRLKEKIEKFPNEGYEEFLEAMKNDRAPHFTVYPDENMGLYRTKLYIDFGKNHFERNSETEFKYDLTLNTWPGIFELDLSSMSDPAYFDRAHKIDILEGYLQGYFFPFVKVTGELARESGNVEVSGAAWLNHVWGEPKLQPQKSIYVTMRTPDGGAFILIIYYDEGGNVADRNVVYLTPDGQMKRDWNVDIESRDTWMSDASKFLYDISWSVSGDALSGMITPLFKDSEIMLEQGAGPFWLGPCKFEGELEGVKTSGEGFCRTSGIEQ